MRHRRRVKHFSRKYTAKKALFRGLVESLVEHERITTTVEKAKELRRHVEKAITMGKKGGLHARRLILAKYPNSEVVQKLMTDLAPRFKERKGGYTRIIKIGKRPGDSAEMAFIEFVDYDFTKPVVKKEVEKADKAEVKADAAEGASVKKKAKKKSVKAPLALKKKTVRKVQKKSRQSARV